MLHTNIPLLAIRAALTDRLNQAMIKAQRGCVENASMPNCLVAACMYAASIDPTVEPTLAECYFGWTPETCARFLDRLTPEQRAAEIEEGRAALFDGADPIVPMVADAAVERRAA